MDRKIVNVSPDKYSKESKNRITVPLSELTVHLIALWEHPWFPPKVPALPTTTIEPEKDEEQPN